MTEGVFMANHPPTSDLVEVLLSSLSENKVSIKTLLSNILQNTCAVEKYAIEHEATVSYVSKFGEKEKNM